MKGVILSSVFVLITFLLIARNVCHAWTFSVLPNRVIDYELSSPTFFGNGSDYFKILSMNDNSVLIGAKNNVYNLSLTRLNENRDNRIEWTSSEAHREMCLLKGKNNSDCQNYIRIYARVSERQIMLCGTNSFKPMCRYYKLNPISDNGSTYEMLQEFEGEAISPYSPTQNNTYIHTDLDELYAATSVGFAGAQQLIFRQRLLSPQSNTQTLRTDFRNDILNQASFVNAVEYNGYIMFFFREQAIEYQNCGKSMYSRVARVCKNDKGGSHPFHDRFSSFLKTRLNCSMPGEYPFYFDELQATSEVIDGIYGNDRDALIYTVMNTNDNAIDGSAICVYSMNSILEAFQGKFKNQRDVNSVWRALDDTEVPASPSRPGQCVDDSRTLPSSTINFILKNPLMDGAVNPIHESPLLVHTGSNYKFTSIAIDSQVETMSGKSYDVIFIGTDNGHVLKLINVGSAESLNGNKPIVVSEQQVLPIGTRIKELKISRATQKLIVVSDNFVRSIPLHNCSGLHQCSDCVGSRDPYCVWDNINRECIFYNRTTMSRNAGMYIESIDGKNDDVCGDGVIPTIKMNHHAKINSGQTHGTVSSFGKNPLPIDGSENNEEEELMKNHKYYSVGVLQAPSSQSTSEYFEPQIQTSSASIVALFAIAALIFGVIMGFTLSKCVSLRNDSARSPFLSNDSHHRNHLGWQANPNKHLLQLPTMNNGGKDINLLMNTNSSTINNINKKDNLELEFSLGSKDRTHECKNSNESLDKETCKSAVISASGGTLQKVKKTYI
ncbi:CLUMA_CG001950, isoform A [Clunio marinus]|uniref:CLUMA_CG001950, isoform A n=1 Tax=Clunio marinus TaxID=568069 RepID=A0A1J1HJH1_9DIPT|nr:CLUMA_CG001950, isoform A [Clunio marinus]